MSALAQNFNLMDEFNILRIICGAFYVPHIYAKFFVPEALGFFKAAGFKPAKPWMYFACVVEVFLATGFQRSAYGRSQAASGTGISAATSTAYSGQSAASSSQCTAKRPRAPTDLSTIQRFFQRRPRSS